jgi:hypothetical protein
VAEAIHIDGLKEFNRALKSIDSALPKATRVALNEAADLVVSDARPKIPKRTGRAAASLRSSSTRTAVRVSGGGRRAPYLPWLDFGGRVGRNRSIVRPFIKEGRYIYHSYSRQRDSGRFVEVLSDALVNVARRAGMEVEDGG